MYDEKDLGNLSFGLQIKPKFDDEDVNAENRNRLLQYYSLGVSTESKKGAKTRQFNQDVKYSNLTSQVETNSHDYSEIKINSSDIYISGSEDSPQKMDVISTSFELVIDYDLLYKDAFEGC
jgi:hypothetical protein